jgi:hypothetical protein
MIAYVGYTGRRGNFGRTHASIATAAVALAHTRGDLLAACNLLLGARPSYPPPPMKLFDLDAHRMPILPLDAGLTIAADFERYCLDFYAPVGVLPGLAWGPIGSLNVKFSLSDVEALEAALYLLGGPERRSMHRRLRTVRPAT